MLLGLDSWSDLDRARLLLSQRGDLLTTLKQAVREIAQITLLYVKLLNFVIFFIFFFELIKAEYISIHPIVWIEGIEVIIELVVAKWRVVWWGYSLVTIN